jgi:hypothetical protein
VSSQIQPRQFLPKSSQTHCYFEAASSVAVEEANQRARIPFTEIVEVVEMTPEMVWLAAQKSLAAKPLFAFEEWVAQVWRLRPGVLAADANQAQVTHRVTLSKHRRCKHWEHQPEHQSQGHTAHGVAEDQLQNAAPLCAQGHEEAATRVRQDVTAAFEEAERELELMRQEGQEEMAAAAV